MGERVNEKDGSQSQHEEYVPGLTVSELRAYFDEVKVQSLRENPLWRQPGYVWMLYALDLIEAQENEHAIYADQVRRVLGSGGSLVNEKDEAATGGRT